MLLPILSSLLGIVAFLPINLYPAGFIWLIPLFIFFLRENKFWRLVWGVFIFRLLLAMGSAYYTMEPMLWTSSILMFLGLPVSVFLFKKLIAWLGKKYPYFFINNYSPDFLPLLFALPFLWTFFDLATARFSLLPTYIIVAGNSLGSSPFVGLAGLSGFTTLTFFAAAINALIAAAILDVLRSYRRLSVAPEKKRWPLKITPFIWRAIGRSNLILLILAPLIIFFAWLFSFWALRANALDYNRRPDSIRLAVVSANEKFNAGQFNELKKELASRPSDLIIFPEDIFNQPASPADSSILFGNPSAVIFQDLARELATDVIAGFETFQGENNARRYGSVVLFDSQGNVAGLHHKNRLTFIGEYWPFGNWLPPLAESLKKNRPEIADYAVFNPKNAYRQGERNVISAALKQKAVLFAAPLCLEIHHPADLKDYRAAGAKFIVNPTSNRWVDPGLDHFLYLTDNLKKIESVWLRLPIISSGVQDPAGLTLPDGKAQLVNYENRDKNYGIFFGEIKY